MKKIRPEVDGSAVYEQADLNTLELPADMYDVVVTKGTLHHLVHLDHLIVQIHRALKPGGFFWIQDTLGSASSPSVLIAGALTFVLPTQTSYAEKGRALRRFGLRSPSRVKASIQAEGLSPFEEAGREHDWLQLVEERFSRIERESLPAFTGYVTAQLKASDRLALPLLRAAGRR